MNKAIRNTVIAGALVVASSGSTILVAQASSTPVYSTSATVKYITSAKCIHTHTHGVRYYSYSSKAGRYVKLVRPSTTDSNSYRCHS